VLKQKILRHKEDYMKKITDEQLEKDIQFIEELCEATPDLNEKLGGCPMQPTIDKLKEELEKRKKKKKKN
jgi:peroxiredoxin family protein